MLIGILLCCAALSNLEMFILQWKFRLRNAWGTAKNVFLHLGDVSVQGASQWSAFEAYERNFQSDLCLSTFI